MQQDIFGNCRLTGSLESQLSEVYHSTNAKTVKELVRAWAEFQYGLTPFVVDSIISADRVARNVIK